MVTSCQKIDSKDRIGDLLMLKFMTKYIAMVQIFDGTYNIFQGHKDMSWRSKTYLYLGGAKALLCYVIFWLIILKGAKSCKIFYLGRVLPPQPPAGMRLFYSSNTDYRSLQGSLENSYLLIFL